MKTRRTPWWQYVIGAVLGLLAGIGLASYGESSGLSLIGAPWIVTGLLAVLGVIVLILALQVHKYANTDPKKRPHSFINPSAGKCLTSKSSANDIALLLGKCNHLDGMPILISQLLKALHTLDSGQHTIGSVVNPAPRHRIDVGSK